jgi:hypothetical protein
VSRGKILFRSGRKDETYRWFLTRALPIRGADGEGSGWLGTNTDVTDQKNAEAEREGLRESVSIFRQRGGQCEVAPG